MTDYADKDAYTEALTVEDLRTKITTAAEGAVKHGVDRDWANEWLRKLGAKQITGRSEYRMNIPLTGSYGWRCKASSRAEAVQRFLEQVQRLAESGKITADGSYDNVYDVKFVEPVIAADVVFYAGPEDPADAEGDVINNVAELKTAIRKMLIEGVAERAWGHRYAVQAIVSMDLEPLPAYSTQTFWVPVSGNYKAQIRVFADFDQEAVQRTLAATLARAGSVTIVPDEVGAVLAQEEPAEDEPENDPF